MRQDNANTVNANFIIIAAAHAFVLLFEFLSSLGCFFSDRPRKSLHWTSPRLDGLLKHGMLVLLVFATKINNLKNDTFDMIATVRQK